MLDKFQNDFVTKNGRKVKFMHDVKEVKEEYKQYKELKIMIANLEAKIKSLANIKSQ